MEQPLHIILSLKENLSLRFSPPFSLCSPWSGHLRRAAGNSVLCQDFFSLLGQETGWGLRNKEKAAYGWPKPLNCFRAQLVPPNSLPPVGTPKSGQPQQHSTCSEHTCLMTSTIQTEGWGRKASEQTKDVPDNCWTRVWQLNFRASLIFFPLPESEPVCSYLTPYSSMLGCPIYVCSKRKKSEVGGEGQ